MGLKIYKMNFTNAHFGDGYLNTSLGYFQASRLYSALYLEALKNDCEHEFLALTQKSDFVLSDAFPYLDEPYLPKPISYPAMKKLNFDTLKDDFSEKKATENIYAVPFSKYATFLAGKEDIYEFLAKQDTMYQVEILMKKGEDPYEVAVTTFKSALYVIAQQSPLFDDLMRSLQYSGLGGKRSSGYGSFELEIQPLPSSLLAGINNQAAKRYISLTTSLPKDEELNRALMGAKYQLHKESGFIYSETGGQALRKKNLYKFQVGSVFTRPYEGGIFDVRPQNYPHPVYNFAKGLFYGI